MNAEQDGLSDAHSQKAQPQKGSGWILKCCLVLPLIGLLVFLNLPSTPRSVANKIEQRCEMTTVLPAKFLPQSESIVVQVKPSNTVEQVMVLEGILMENKEVFRKVHIDVDGDQWVVEDFRGFVEFAQQFGLNVSVYMSKNDLTMKSQPQ